MRFNTFKIEDYYEKYEFNTQYMLSSSDAESWSLDELLQLATPEEKSMWDSQWLGYTQTRGLPALRNAIASKLYQGLSHENIICFSGAEEGIFCSLLTLCSPNDHVIVLTPCYQSLMEIPKFVGSDITPIELKEKNNWQIDITAIKKAIQPNTKCVIINFPHNPTGQTISSSKLKQLIELLAKHNIWLFSDEVYHSLGATPEQTKPAACLYEKAISLGVMSKSFGLPGLRIGWIACQDKKILEEIIQNRHYTTICNSSPSEILALIALNNKDFLLARNNEIVASNIILLDDFFKKYKDIFSWVRPQASCTGFVKYLKSESVDTFCKRAAKEAGVLLLPGSVYELKSNHFRIGFGRKNMPEALNQLEQFILNNRGRS